MKSDLFKNYLIKIICIEFCICVKLCMLILFKMIYMIYVYREFFVGVLLVFIVKRLYCLIKDFVDEKSNVYFVNKK